MSEVAERFDPNATIWPEGILKIDWDYDARNVPCKWCGKPMGDHGLIKIGEAYKDVCPDFWIVTEESGHRYAISPDVYKMDQFSEGG